MALRGRVLGLIALASVCASAGDAQARAWTRDAGEGTIRLTYSYLGADEVYGADGETLEILDYHQHTINVFAEIGLIDRWLTLSAEGPVYRWNQVEGQGSSQGIGDLRVGAWSGLLQGAGLRLTAGVLFGINSGDDSESIARNLPPGVPPGAIESLPPEVEPELPNGDGEFDVEWRLAFGSDMRWLPDAYPLQHYLEAEFGFQYHTDQDEAVTYSLKVGTKLPLGVLSRVWLTASLYGVESFADDEDVEVILTGVGNGASFTAFGLELSVDLGWNLELFARFDSALRARGLPATSVLSAGAGFSF